jgi:hypothetical protein
MAFCARSAVPKTMGCRVAKHREETELSVNKVTWQQVGHVTEPGRYMFRFGWLTVAADDLEIWTQYPHASFTLVQTYAPDAVSDTETADDSLAAETDEFHLGAFELHTNDDSYEHHAAA